MNRFSKVAIIALAGLLCVVLTAQADKKKPSKHTLEDELIDLAHEHEDIKEECDDLQNDIVESTKNKSMPCPKKVEDYKLCKDYLKTIRKHMKEAVNNLTKDDDLDDDDDDDDDDD